MTTASATVLPFLLFLSISCAQHELRLIPERIQGIVGEPLVVACVIPANVKPVYNSSQLAFEIQKGRDVTQLNDQLIDRVNGSVAVLNVPAVPADWDKVRLGCVDVRNRSIPDSRYMNISHRCALVTVTHYEVSNCETFWFRWTYNSSTHGCYYEGWFRNSTQLMFTRCNDSVDGSNYCEVEEPFAMSSDGVLIVKVNGSNVLTNTTTKDRHIQLHNIVRPGKVKSLKVRSSSENTADNFVNFEAPAKRSITYNIIVSCDRDGFHLSKQFEPIQWYHIDSVIRKRFSGLPAYSNCTFSVNARPSQGGFVSAWNNYTHLTAQQVPLAAPEVCSSCFQLVNRSESHQLDIVIYFHSIPVSLARGVITKYRVGITNHSHSRRVQLKATDKQFVQLHRLTFAENYVILELDAGTSAGYNNSLHLKVIRVHQSRHVSAADFITVALNTSTLQCMWESVHDVQQYTIFSCSSSLQDGLCHSEVNWWNIEGSVTSTQLVLPSDVVSENHVFGIALQTMDGYSSGIMWHPCTYLATADAVPDKPVVQKELDGCCDVVLTLRRPPCSDGAPHGHTMTYVVSYCVTQSDADVCHGSTVERQVAAAVGEVVVSLTDLEPVRFYHIWVSSMSTANSQSTAVHLTVKTGPGSLSAAIITVIVIASCMIIVLFVAGAAFIFRHGRRLCRKLEVEISPPAHFASNDVSTGETTRMMSETYSSVAQDHQTAADTVSMEVLSAKVLPETGSGMETVSLRLHPKIGTVLDADLPILPSTDSDSLPRLHRISPTHIDRQSEGYAPGLACHRSPFVQPLETEALPLRHFSIDDQPIDDEDACHDHHHHHQQQQQQPDSDSNLLPATSPDHTCDSTAVCEVPPSDNQQSFYDYRYSKARVG